MGRGERNGGEERDEVKGMSKGKRGWEVRVGEIMGGRWRERGWTDRDPFSPNH